LVQKSFNRRIRRQNKKKTDEFEDGAETTMGQERPIFDDRATSALPLLATKSRRRGG
jgi:hypothetical protein